MAVTNFGSVRLATVRPDDIEIYYVFTPDRYTDPTSFTPRKLDAATVLAPAQAPGDQNFGVIGGMYHLKLPKAEFSSPGIYSLLIRPRRQVLNIEQCAVLSSLPDVKGLVLDASQIPGVTNNSLNGYVIEYLDNGQLIPNLSRVVTSCNMGEIVVEALSNNNASATRFRFSQGGSKVFLTVSPSAQSAIKANNAPFIGSANQQIIMANTFFDPIMVEVEMVEHDLSTIAHALYGNQTRSLRDGKYTIYDEDNNIYAQYNLYDIRDEYDKPTYEVRERTDEIDVSKNFDDITGQ